jgi:type IV pilus assembly protein PilW
VFEGQKRSTTGTADAQTNGGVALYTIGRDLQMAGYGLLPVIDSAIECSTPSIDPGALANPVVATPSATRISLDLSPVILTDGASAADASDSISIVYGTNTMGGVPSLISAIVGTTVTVDNNLGCRVCDIALVINGPVCTATIVMGPAASAVTCPSITPPALSTTDTLNLLDVVGVAAGANVACLGAWNRILYRVNNGNLEVNGAPTLAGIVNIQAQYGVSANVDENKISQWVNAASPWDAATLTVANRNRIKAVRLAVVARNSLWEKDVVSTACSSTTTAAPTGVCAWEGNAASPAPAIDLSNDPDWAHYRYRVFETIIPLRNMIWARETL